MTAVEMITEAFRAVTPPGVPLPFSRILTARKQGKKAVGALEMADGSLATVEVGTFTVLHEESWSIKYTEWPGGPLYWDGTQWLRDKAEVAEGV